jgi:hypothetical protein
MQTQTDPTTAQQELDRVLEHARALERVLSRMVMLHMDIAMLKADLCLCQETNGMLEDARGLEQSLSDMVVQHLGTQFERDALEKERRAAKAAEKRLAGQIKRIEAREAERRQAQTKAESQARKEQERLEAQAQEASERERATRARKAIKSGVLPGHDDPESRRLCAIALVEAKKKEREQTKRTQAFVELMLTKVFTRGQLRSLKFTPFTEVPTALLVRFYMEERIGTNGFRMQVSPLHNGQYRLTCFLDTEKRAPFSSPFVELEDITSWLDRQDFADACLDMFGYDVEGPCITKNARDIYNAFQSVSDEEVFATLRLRELWRTDCFDLETFEITAVDTKGAMRDIKCSMIQLVVWYALGKVHALASTHATGA